MTSVGMEVSNTHDDAYSVGRWRQLRHLVGFGLVEAGLHMLASTRPAP